MANWCGIAVFHAVFCGLTLDTVLCGMSTSFRGAKMQNMMHHLDDKLSEIKDELSEVDMPDVHETDDNEEVLGGPGVVPDLQTDVSDLAEVADSDENDDMEKSDEEDVDSDEGEGIHEHADTIEHLTRVSNIADTNSDGMLSPEELVTFADGLRSKKKWEHTRSALGALDANGDGHVAQAEMENQVSTPGRSDNKKRFVAADLNSDGLLNETEFHAFAFPAAHHMVLKVETGHQFEIFDRDGDKRISLEEFIKDDQHLEDFSHEAAHEDYFLHDFDGSGDLDADEFKRLLAGHDLLLNSVNKTISAVDIDGDGHISISEEVPDGIRGLLDSEFIEDFFYHEYLGRHEEL